MSDDFQFLRWGDSRAFYYAFFIIGLIAIYFIFEKIFFARLREKLGAQVTPFLTQSVSYSKRRWQLFFQATGLLFIVIALARPQIGTSQQEIRSEHICCLRFLLFLKN